MRKVLVSGLLALVLSSCGALKTVEPAMDSEVPPIEAKVSSDDIRSRYEETKKKCYVADALYKKSSNGFIKWYEEAISNIEYYKLPIKDNPDFALAYNRMAEYYLALREYDKAEKYADIAFKNFPHPLFKATVDMIKRERDKERKKEKQKAIFTNFI